MPDWRQKVGERSQGSLTPCAEGNKEIAKEFTRYEGIFGRVL